MEKQCWNCGAALPEAAAFCPHCAKSQVERRAVRPPRRWRKGLLAALAVLALAAAGLAWALHKPAPPQRYEGEAELAYPADGHTYQLLLTFAITEGVARQPQALASAVVADGESYAFPSQLHVYEAGNDADVTEAFLQLVEDYTLETIPEAGAKAMWFSPPGRQESFPYAALMADIHYDNACGTNRVRWTLQMKNGDTVVMEHAVRAEPQPQVSYYYEEVDMETVEALQALLDEIAQEVDPQTSVSLYLPPVTYQGGITMRDRSYALHGSTDGENQTTFTGTVYVETWQPQIAELTDLCFSGQGGIGLSASDGVMLLGCTFTGWETAALARDGAWISAQECTFSGNGTGLHFESNRSGFSASGYFNNRFEDNETAIRILALRGTEVLDFTGSVFTGNGVDLDNPADHPVDLSGATQE